MDWPAFLSAAARLGPLADPSPEAAPDRAPMERQLKVAGQEEVS